MKSFHISLRLCISSNPTFFLQLIQFPEYWTSGEDLELKVEFEPSKTHGFS